MKRMHTILLLSAMLLVNVTEAQLGLLKKKKEKEEKEEAKPEVKTETGAAPVAGYADEKSMKDNKTAWENNFETSIDWFSLSAVGNLIVSTNNALYGVDGVTGKVIWKNEKFGNLQQDNFAMIDKSPYVAIVSGGMLNRQHTILNVLDGKLVADTREMGYKMVGKRYPVPAQDGFLLTAVEDNKSTILFIDAPNSKQAWKLQDVFTKNNEIVNTKPLAVSADAFLIATDKHIYMLNSKEGRTVFAIPFKTPTEPLKTETRDKEGITESTKADEPKKKGGLGLLKVIPGVKEVAGVTEAASNMNFKGAANLASTESSGRFFRIDDSERVYYFNNKYFAIIDTKNGKLMGEPFKFDDNLATFIPDTKGFVFATDEKKSELYYIDAVTGQNRWGNPVQLKGKINSISLNEGKLAVSSAKESGKNFVNIIDVNTGDEVSKKDMAVKGQVNQVVMTKRGLIYTTTDETNIQDPVSGKDVISKSLKYKSGGATARKDGKYYLINDNEISCIDETTGEVTTFAKVNFKDNENPQQIELLNEGILVSSNQNMILLGWDGREKYHTFYKAPGVSLAGKVLGGLTMAVSLTNSAAHGYAAGTSGFGTAAYDDHMEKADRWSNLGSSGASQFSKRFNMTASSRNYQVILSKIDDGEDKGFGLVKVSKQTGQADGKVVIGDKKPDYLFDEANSMIYYKNANKKIIAYKL